MTVKVLRVSVAWAGDDFIDGGAGCLTEQITRIHQTRVHVGWSHSGIALDAFWRRRHAGEYHLSACVALGWVTTLIGSDTGNRLEWPWVVMTR